jgi:hypothetical protein
MFIRCGYILESIGHKALWSLIEAQSCGWYLGCALDEPIEELSAESGLATIETKRGFIEIVL